MRATVKLPGSVPSEDMTQAVQTGYRGGDERLLTRLRRPWCTKRSDFPPYTNFWIVTGFPKGVVEFTWTARRVAAFLVPKVGFLLPIAVFLAMLLLWRGAGATIPRPSTPST